jgi:hypothetical protein
MEPQEINEKLATEIMSWHKDQDGYPACDSYYDKDDNFIMMVQAFNPWEDHPEYDRIIGEDRNIDDQCRCLLNTESIDMDYMGIAPKDHESQAICNCLIKAKEVKE